MRIKKNIKLILNESYRWRNRKLIESKNFKEPNLTFIKFLLSNVYYLVLGLIISIFFRGFFNSNFAGFAITSLSIFIGLFTTVLILIFDKYLNHSKRNNLEDANPAILLDYKRTKNFSRKFVFVSLEALLIAVSVIILLLIPLMLKEGFLIDILKFKFVRGWPDFLSIGLFFSNLLILFTRILLVILLFKFFKYLFIIFGFLGAYIKGVFEDNVNV